MSQQSRYNGNHVIMALIGGAAAGVAVGYLTAPKSGRESRKQLRGYVQGGVDQGRAVPSALMEAGGAARDAFASSMNESSEHGVISVLSEESKRMKKSDGPHNNES